MLSSKLFVCLVVAILYVNAVQSRRCPTEADERLKVGCHGYHGTDLDNDEWELIEKGWSVGKHSEKYYVNELNATLTGSGAMHIKLDAAEHAEIYLNEKEVTHGEKTELHGPNTLDTLDGDGIWLKYGPGDELRMTGEYLHIHKFNVTCLGKYL